MNDPTTTPLPQSGIAYLPVSWDVSANGGQGGWVVNKGTDGSISVQVTNLPATQDVRLTNSSVTQAVTAGTEGTSGQPLPGKAVAVAGEDGTNLRAVRVSATAHSSDGVAAGSYAMYQSAFQEAFNGATWDRVRVPNVFKTTTLASLGAASPGTLWTPGVNKKIRLMGFVISATVAGSFFIRMGTAGSGAIVVPFNLVSNQSLVVDLRQGRLANAVNDVVEVYNNNGTTAIVYSALWGTEE